MLLYRSAINSIKTSLRLTNTLSHNFAKKKAKRGDEQRQEKVSTNQRLIEDVQTALYDHYLKSRQRPMLTLDNYCIRYTLLIERTPIFVPFETKRFNYYKTKYQNLKKTNLYPQTPKQLQVQSGDYLFQQYQRTNPQNEITHRNQISKTEIYQYAQNSRYWRYTDPSIIDSHSIQTYSSDTVFLIVKNHNGKWEFPTKQLMEKDNHKQVFTVMNQQLFSGAPAPYVYFMQNKPVYVRKVQDDSLERGVGFYNYYFKGLSINGIPKFPTKNYSDFAWVPKPHLSQYFDQEYFEQSIKLAIHK